MSTRTITLWTTADTHALGDLKKGDSWPSEEGWDGTYFWAEEAYDGAFDNASSARRGVLIRVTAEVVDAEVEWVAPPPPPAPPPSPPGPEAMAEALHLVLALDGCEYEHDTVRLSPKTREQIMRALSAKETP